mgnify:CR=1 FL=1
MAEKTRYSDAELEEFRAIIMEKLELAQRDYDRLKSSIMNKDGNDTDDTSPTYKSFWKKVLIHCLKKKRPGWRHVS